MRHHEPHRRLRDQRATRSAVMGVAFQGVYALGQLLVMAVLFRQIDQQRFGMWLIIYSLTAWMAFAKFGLQFTLYTALGQHAMTDRDKARAILSNAAAFVALLSLLLAAAWLTIGWYLPWADWLNVTDPLATREAGPVAVTALTLAVVAMPLMMGGHAMLASQRGDLTQGIAMSAQVLMVAALLLGFWLDWPLIALAAVVMCPPVFAGVVQWVVGIHSGILPGLSVKDLDAGLLRQLLTAGVVFMALDVATITLLQGGPIVLGHVVSPEAVVPYGAAYRLIGLLIAAVMMVCYAYWPAYSDAGQRAEHDWVRQGVIRSLVWVLLLCAAGAGLILTAGQPFIRWWLGQEAVPTRWTLVAAVLFASLFGCYAALGVPLSGLGRLRQQCVSAAVMFGVFLIAGIGLATRYGAAGLYLGQALAAGAGAVLNGLFLHRTMTILNAKKQSS